MLGRPLKIALSALAVTLPLVLLVDAAYEPPDPVLPPDSDLAHIPPDIRIISISATEPDTLGTTRSASTSMELRRWLKSRGFTQKTCGKETRRFLFGRLVCWTRPAENQ